MNSIYWTIYYFLYDTAPIFIAMLAVYVSIRALKQKEKHDKLSVKPILRTHIQITSEIISVAIKNKGLGPAEIVKYDVFFEKNKIEGLLSNYFAKYAKEKNLPTVKIYSRTITAGSHIQVNEEAFIFRSNLSKGKKFSNKDKENYMKLIEKISVEINYNSIYGEEFELNSELKRP